MDIIITIPKDIPWEEYQKELDAVKDGRQVMNYKVAYHPKCEPGDKCYVVHNGYIRGYMLIKQVVDKEFKCTTTGKNWKGKFVERTGEFYTIEPVEMKGFQGIRYVPYGQKLK